jgi:hypothetical protein
MNERSFDKLIRDRLKDHESAVPADMWRRIHHKEEDDRKFFFLWPWLAVVAVVAILSLLAGRILHNPAMPRSVNLSSAHLANSPVRKASTTASSIPSMRLATTSPRPAMPSSNSKSRPLRPTKTPSFLPPAPDLSHPPDLSHAPDPSPTPGQFALSAVAVQLPQHPLFRSAPIFAKPLPGGKPNPIPCWDPTRSSHPGTWSLSVYGASGLSTGAPNRAILYGAGFLLRKDLMAGLSVAAGLQYSWISIKGLTDSLAPFGGHFMNVDLPALAGYEKTYSNFSAAVDAGIIINLHSTPEGRYAAFQNLYRSSTGISMYLGLRFTKELDDRLSLFAAPYYRRQLSDPSGNNAPLAQTFNIGGLLIGIKYNFSGRSKQ